VDVCVIWFQLVFLPRTTTVLLALDALLSFSNFSAWAACAFIHASENRLLLNQNLSTYTAGLHRQTSWKKRIPLCLLFHYKKILMKYPQKSSAADLGCLSRIRTLNFTHPGSRGQKDTGFRIRNTAERHPTFKESIRILGSDYHVRMCNSRRI
jgi:hypothetical protein